MRKVGAALFVIAVGLPSALCAQDIGQIVYIQGSVELVRGEQTLDSGLSIGDSIQDLDMIRTGDDGQVTIATTADSGASATINVNPNTTFTFDLGSIDTPTVHTLNLMDGTLAMSVAALASGSVLNVDTGSAVMGIRGTVFDVSSIPSGDVLLTVNEGKVSCTTDGGKTLYAQPGVIVENMNQSWDNRDIPAASLASFRQTWRSNRIAFMNEHADEILARAAGNYLRLRSQLDARYNELMRHRSTIERWLANARAGKLSAAELSRVRRVAGRRLIAAHRSLVAYEHVYYRVKRLETLSHQGVQFTQAQSGLTASAFFTEVEGDHAGYVEKMRQIRVIVATERRQLRSAAGPGRNGRR